ncbi:helix-turn-helix transcriptional regulator [Proteinivorax tanatarense]|uniref:Helix-turn-helix transcriptional regulator n=1 Tax=Proteinivorax tanatarense TaxID=1260629 RepID=A0AAU7VJ56_9FIRM
MFVKYELDGFGEELRRIRKNIGYNQLDVEQIVAISADTIRRIEAGQVIPRYETLELLSLVYKQDLLDVLKSYRCEKLLYEYHDDLDYAITSGNKEKIKELQNQIETNITSIDHTNILNPKEIDQFLAFIKALKVHITGQLVEVQIAKVDLINNLRLTIPSFDLKKFDSYNYCYIEYRILLLISLLIVKEEKFSFSNKILYFILYELLNDKFKTQYIDSLIAKVYSNIAYNFHRLDEHPQVIKICIKGINYCLKNDVFRPLYLLYYRQGIAQYHLGVENYVTSVENAFYLLKSTGNNELLKKYIEVSKEKYGIIIPNFLS